MQQNDVTEVDDLYAQIINQFFNYVFTGIYENVTLQQTKAVTEKKAEHVLFQKGSFKLVRIMSSV